MASQLHHALSGWHHVAASIGMYFYLFVCIWWPWNSYTWLASGYDTDDAQFRLASFAQMVGAIIMASGVKAAFVEGQFVTIMIGYVVMRIPYVVDRRSKGAVSGEWGEARWGARASVPLIVGH